jgi:ubiquinone/menaquinone biosynthesis C-methylase UbiE
MGGYQYDDRFFSQVVLDFIEYYGVTHTSSVLDIGCGKGFMVHDFMRLADLTEVYGLDISRYCLENAHGLARGRLILGTCDFLPFPDKSFDICIAIATIHNLDLVGVTRSLKEIVRVARQGAFVKVNGYKNNYEKERLLKWNLVAKTILPVDEWENLFADVGYQYDYDFFST